MKKALLLIFMLLVSFRMLNASQVSKKDSILQIIRKAKGGAYMNTIKTEVGAKILALNNWANDATWNNPDEVGDVCRAVIQYAITEKNDSLLSWSYHYLGLSYAYMHYWNLSTDMYEKALSNAWAKYAASARSFRAFCTLNIGCNYEALGDYDKAADYYYTSIRFNEELELPYVVAEVKLDLASLHLRMNNLGKARKNILEAVSVLKDFKDSVRVSEAYRMMSSLEVSDKNYTEAKKYFRKALSIGIKLNDQERLAKLYQNYGDALFSQGKLQEASYNYKMALKHCILEKFPLTYYLVIGSLGKVQLANSQFREAEKNLLEAYYGLNKLSASGQLLELEQILTDLYAKSGNYKQYQYYSDLAGLRKDSLNTIEKLRSIGESEVIYKTAQKDRQIQYQKSKLKNKRKQILLILFIALSLLIGLIIVLLLLKKVRVKNKKLLERNIELTKKWNQIQESYFCKETSTKESLLFKSIYNLVVGEQEFTNPKLSINYLAKTLHTNNKYVSKAIGSTTGMNFNSFINTFRIEKAKELLRSKEAYKYSLETIAERCGFNNATTFYQTFKSNTGLTPSTYRNIRS